MEIFMQNKLIPYEKFLKPYGRTLRTQMTDAEIRLWYRIRRKQILNVQFYRQKPIGPYIVDFFSASTHLVIELDGSQHFEQDAINQDKERDIYLQQLGLKVLRFDNGQIMHSLDGVLEQIYNILLVQLKNRPLCKGGRAQARGDFNDLHKYNTNR